MADRDLKLGVEVVGAPEAKAQLDSLKQSTDALGTENAQVASSATAAAAATTEQAAATRVATAAAAGQVVEQTAVVGALREARASMVALAASTAEGGSVMTAALGRAAIAVAGLEAEIIATKASGGVVTAAQMAGLDTYKARLAELALGLRTTGASTEFATGHSRLLTTATTQAANAIAGKSVQVGALGGAMLRLVTGPIGLFITAVTLLPSLIKIVVDTVGNWSTKIGETIAGLNEQDGVLRKSGESTEAYTARANAAAEAQALHERAIKAADAGIIPYTDDVQALTAAYVLHQAAARGVVAPTQDLEQAAKALGITLIATYSGATNAAVQAFLDIYASKLKEGQFSADEFAAANKGMIEEWISSMQRAHADIPPTLVDIAAKQGVLTEKWKETKSELEATVAHLRDYWKACNDARDATHGLAQSQEELNLMIEQTASQTFRLSDGMEISNSKIEAQRAQTNELIESLHSLAKELYGVDDASEKAFAGAEEE